MSEARCVERAAVALDGSLRILSCSAVAYLRVGVAGQIRGSEEASVGSFGAGEGRTSDADAPILAGMSYLENGYRKSTPC